MNFACRAAVALLAALTSLVLPAPATGGGFAEDFATAPEARGWTTFGDAGLFAWEADAQALRVTWDSSRPNSYFARPLELPLDRADDFALAFDLTLEDVAVAVNPAKPYTFELAVGLLNWAEATRPDFRRGTGTGSPNLVEFDYFPDSGYGATVWPTFISSSGRFNYSGAGDFTILELTPGDTFGIALRYTAADATLRTTLLRNGAPAGPVNAVRLMPNFTDYRVDTLAIASYSDAGAQGSLLAHGLVDNVRVELPPPPPGAIQGQFAGGAWQVSFAARTNWVYALERAADFAAWTTLATNRPLTNGVLTLADPAPLDRAFYRVRATKP